MKKLLVLALLVVFVFGCEPPGQVVATGAPDGVNSRSSSLLGTWTYGPYYDWGYAERNSYVSTSWPIRGFWVEVYHHFSYYSGTVNDGTATIGANEVLVGGAAYASGYAASLTSGPFLTASNPVIDPYPSYGLDEDDQPIYCDARSWHGRSQGAAYQQTPHTLLVEAVGMKLGGPYFGSNNVIVGANCYLKRSALLEYMRYTWSADSAMTAHPHIVANTYKGFQLLSGGAEVLDTGGAGNFLTDSYGYIDYSYGYPLGKWYVASKDHMYSSPARIRAYAIGMIQNTGRESGSLPNGCNNMNNSSYPADLASMNDLSRAVSIPGGDHYARLDNTPDEESGHMGVVIGVGVRTTYNGYGRMISGLYLLNTFIYVRTKDCTVADSGTVIPQLRGIYLDND
jgi:hypothetical protein